MTTLRSRVYLAGALLALATMSPGMLRAAGSAGGVPQADTTMDRAAAEQKATVSAAAAPRSDTNQPDQIRSRKYNLYTKVW